MRSLVEDAFCITAKHLGSALSNDAETGTVCLQYFESYEQEIRLTSTPGNAGGLVRWFRCPGCHQRSAGYTCRWENRSFFAGGAIGLDTGYSSFGRSGINRTIGIHMLLCRKSNDFDNCRGEEMRYCRQKMRVEACCRLPISYLRQQGLLRHGKFVSMSWCSSITKKTSSAGLTVDLGKHPHVRLAYHVSTGGDSGRDYDYNIPLQTTTCTYGGVRHWFSCPDCGRRVGTLYLVPGDAVFRCRHCNGLTYQSRTEGDWGRIGFFMRTHQRIEALQVEIKRQTWAGRPTRKVRRLHALQRRAELLSHRIPRQWRP